MPVLGGFRLDGKNATVTGAGRGICQALAVALAEAGAKVSLVGRDVAGACSHKPAFEVAREE